MESVDIKDISGNLRFSTSIGEGSKRKYTLQKEDYITLKFSLDAPIQFNLGDNVECDFGLFEVCDLQKPTFNINTAGYDYELRFDAHYWKWKNKIFKYTPETAGQEASWSLTASLDVQAGIVLRNLKALGYKYNEKDYEFAIDDTVENKAQLMSYDNINILDACFEMAKKWDCECWVTENIVHFGRWEFGDPVDFEIGVNVEDMTRSDSQTDYATRIYAFGSTRNIPSNYHPVDESVVVNGVVQHRLMLPVGTPYIDAYPNMTTEEAIEQVVVFDDIFPRRIGTMSDITIKEYTDTVENGDGSTSKEKWDAYRFKDLGITFSTDYIIEGEELKITFQSGKLNGMVFGVAFDPDGKDEQVWEIVRNEDYGRKLPDNVLIPADGDTYILSGWDSTKIAELGLVSSAEQELKTEAEKYVAKSKIDPNTYDCKMVSDDAYREDKNHNLYGAGQKVNLINKAFFENGRQSRIIGFEYNLDLPYDSPSYTVGETASYSRIGELEDKIDSLTLKGQTYNGSGGRGIYLITSHDSTPATDNNAYSARRALKMFLCKDRPDIAQEIITFLKGLLIGTYSPGHLGTGACIDENGYGEMTGLKLREFLEAPEYRFNRVDVVFGELWNAAAFGLIESVDVVNQIITLKLEESELSGIHPNDFCRGIFHNQFSTSEIVDGCGFKTLSGFSTSYFTPVEILDNGKRFRYSLKSGTTVHPCKAMKFVVYGNPTDKSRQASAYSTRTYKRYLTGVNTWEIDPERNIAMQFGDCSGLNINGEDLSGYSAYLNNVYITGVIKWLEEHIDELKGKDGYSVALSSYDAVIAVNSDGEIDSSLYDIINIVAGNELVYAGNNQVVTKKYKVQTTIQALRGSTVLAPSDTIGEGKYLVSITPKGCEYNYADGVITITKITQDKATLEIEINCEGMASFINTFTLTRVYGERGTDGNSIYAEYSSDGNVWHATFIEGDIYMRQRLGDGEWSLAYRIVGETGDAGVDGRYTDYQFAVNSSLTESPVTGWQDTPPTVAVGQYLWMRSGLVTPPLTEPEKWTSVRIGGKDGDDGKDGDEAYSVSLSSYDTAITLNNKGEIDSSLYDIINIVAGNELVYAGNNQVVTKKYKVQTSVYAFHGATKLEYADIAVAGKYSLSVTAYGCEYLIADGVITVTKITQDKASLDIVINCENKIIVTKEFNITRIWNGQDANLLPWVDEWNSNKTEIGGDFFISPKMFSGTRDEVTGKLTGVASGRDCITIDGVKHTGIFGIVDDEIRFTLDPLSKKFIFKGEVHADSGTFNNVYVNGFVASSFSDVYDKTAENIPSTMNYIVKTDSGLDFFLPNSDKYIGSVLSIYLAVTITGDNNVRIGNSLAGGAGVTYKGWSVICLARYSGTIIRLMATGRNRSGNLNWEIINYTSKRFSLVVVNNDTYIIDRAVTALEVDKSGINSYSELLAYWDTL